MKILGLIICFAIMMGDFYNFARLFFDIEALFGLDYSHWLSRLKNVSLKTHSDGRLALFI